MMSSPSLSAISAMHISTRLQPCRPNSIYLPSAPRYLHSFPTRRSSDLAPTTAQVAHSAVPGRLRCAAQNQEGRTERKRSEEHTSELQSRGHLVCRLLLEKKNNTWRNLRKLRDRADGRRSEIWACA